MPSGALDQPRNGEPAYFLGPLVPITQDRTYSGSLGNPQHAVGVQIMRQNKDTPPVRLPFISSDPTLDTPWPPYKPIKKRTIPTVSKPKKVPGNG